MTQPSCRPPYRKCSRWQVCCVCSVLTLICCWGPWCYSCWAVSASELLYSFGSYWCYPEQQWGGGKFIILEFNWLCLLVCLVLSVCLSVCLSILSCLFACLPVRLLVCMSVFTGWLGHFQTFVSFLRWVSYTYHHVADCAHHLVLEDATTLSNSHLESSGATEGCALLSSRHLVISDADVKADG